jgi:carbonic anhydrase/acetyltransferase-like protein (isoleucine patch superfamily)
MRFLPWGEGLEGRQLLSGSWWPPYISHAELKALLNNPVGNPAVPPNTPVLPFGAPVTVTPTQPFTFQPGAPFTVTSAPTFIDPTAQITNGYAVIVSSGSFIGPYSKLDAHGGIMKIGIGSTILDNASIVANPVHAHTAPAPEVKIGNLVIIGYGAQVLGPSTIGAYGSAAKPTGIGPRAVIDQAIIEPGAYVSALARVDPGVTVPSGFLVLPGKHVTTNAQASDPTLGMVVTTTGTPEARQIVSELDQLRSTNLTLAAGYVQLYQGQAATGPSPGVDPAVSTVFNGNLAAVEGAGQQPGSATPATPFVTPGAAAGVQPFLPPGRGPTFLSHRHDQVQGLLRGFRARATGRDVFVTQQAGHVAHRLGRSNSIRADQGQPPIAAQQINIGSIAQTGFGVTISAPLKGTGTTFTINQNFRADTGAVIIGAPGLRIGDNVSIGAGAVVDGSSLRSGTTVGAGAYVLNFGPDKSNLLPANIPAGTIWINGVEQ